MRTSEPFTRAQQKARASSARKARVEERGAAARERLAEKRARRAERGSKK